jgi:hypothetical protein
MGSQLGKVVATGAHRGGVAPMGRQWSSSVQRQLLVDPVADRGLKKNDTRRGPPRQHQRFTAQSQCDGGSAVTRRWTDGIEGQLGRHRGARAEVKSTRGRERRRVPAALSWQGREEKWGAWHEPTRGKGGGGGPALRHKEERKREGGLVGEARS